MTGTLSLSSDDHALVERDVELAGLGLVLSDAALSDALGLDVRVERVRYKPRRSAVASWKSTDGTSHGWVGAYRAPEKVHKAVATADHAGVWAAVLDADRHVVATDARGDRALSRHLMAIEQRDPGLFETAQLLRHNPMRRQVWRRDDIVLRVGTEPVARRHATSATLAAHDVPVLLPRRVEGAPSAEVIPWWGDGDLRMLPSATAAASAGRGLATWHRVPLPRRHGKGTPSVSLAGPTSALLDLEPAWRRRLVPLRQRIEHALRHADRPGPVRLHADLSADQVLVSGDEIAFIDLDRMQTGPAEQDLGSFLAAAHLDGQHDLVLPFLDGYEEAGGRYDSMALAAWQAASLVRRAVEPFRGRALDWPRRSAAVLSAAEQLLP